jgi:DNA-binding NarL/FixJ family response regulator
MGAKQRIFIVEDHTLLRAGLRALLSQDPDMEIVGEADNGRDAIRSIAALAPNLVLMDISMPGMNGIEATRILHAEMPEVRVIGLSMFEQDEQAAIARQAGAVNYLTKSGPAEMLLDAIRACVRNE